VDKHIVTYVDIDRLIIFFVDHIRRPKIRLRSARNGQGDRRSGGDRIAAEAMFSEPSLGGFFLCIL
jgi:hypothetical protein